MVFTDPSGHICLDPFAPSGFHLDPNRGCSYSAVGSTGPSPEPPPTPYTPPTPTPAPPRPSGTPTPKIEDYESKCGIGVETQAEDIMTKYLSDQLDTEAAYGLSNEIAKYLKKYGLPPVTKHVLVSFGMGDIRPGKFVFHGLTPEEATRLFGRTIGTGHPATYILGWFLTVAPEQIENFRSGAPPQEYWVDFQIDTLGFVLSEGAGLITAGGTLLIVGDTGVGAFAAIPLEFVADIYVGAQYDKFISDQNIREEMINALIENDCRQLYNKENQSEITPVPKPTP